MRAKGKVLDGAWMQTTGSGKVDLNFRYPNWFGQRFVAKPCATLETW